MGLYSGGLIHGLNFALVKGVDLYAGGLIRGSLWYMVNAQSGKCLVGELSIWEMSGYLLIQLASAEMYCNNLLS